MTGLSTLFLLGIQYGGAAIVPLETVRKDYFPHLSMEKLIWKSNRGEFDLPIVYLERSAKTAKGVALQDLAFYLDRQRDAALSEYEKLHGQPFDATPR